MATQKFLSDLWSRYGLIYKNENIFTSHNSEPTSQSSTTLTSQPSNPDQSVIQGAKAHSYQSPVQEIYIYPPTTPPIYFQRNEKPDKVIYHFQEYLRILPNQSDAAQIQSMIEAIESRVES